MGFVEPSWRSERLDRLLLRAGGWHDLSTVVRFLERDPKGNLFALSWVEAHGMRTAPLAASHQLLMAEDSGELVGVCLVLGGRTAMPITHSAQAARAFGRRLAALSNELEHVVGAQDAVGNLWEGFGQGLLPRLDRDQRYYTLLPRDLIPSPKPTPVRLAELADLEAIVQASAAMYREETLADPFDDDPESFRKTHRQRILQNASFVWREPGQMLFKADISCSGRHGAQLAGVFTHPAFRGQGVARRALAEICARLLAHFPCLTLYVNEDNAPAIRLYEALGFVEHGAYRTIFVT